MTIENEQILTFVVAGALLFIALAFFIGFFIGRRTGRIAGKIEAYEDTSSFLNNL